MKVNYENEASTNCTTKQFWDFGQTSNSVPLSFSNKFVKSFLKFSVNLFKNCLL